MSVSAGDTWVQRICGLDKRNLYVKVAAGNALAPAAADGRDDRPSAGSREALRSEYRLLGRLRGSVWQSPVAYYRFPGGDYMVTEAAPGEPITGIGPVSTEVLAQVLPRLLEGLRHLHALGFVHADLQPDHVFLDRSVQPPEVTLIGLGPCVRTGSQAQIFTVGHSSPEAIQGDVVGEEADIYSLATVIFFLLAGEAPVTGQVWGRVLSRQLQTDPSLPPNTPHLLQTLLEAMLDPDPRCRPSSVREVEQWLRQIWPRDPFQPALDQEPHFPAIPRAEEESLLHWLASLRDQRDRGSTGRLRLEVQGERGMGARQLALTFLDLAETDGWLVDRHASRGPDESGPIGRIRTLCAAHPDRFQVEVLQAQIAPLRPVDLESGVRGAEQNDSFLCVTAQPLERSEFEAWVALHVESHFLRHELSQVTMGNPGLLAAILPNVSPLCDLLDSVPDDQIRDRSFQTAGPPSLWIAWCRDVLATLSEAAAGDLVRRALSFWLEASPQFFTPPDREVLPLLDRGFLTSKWQIRSSLWAQAVLQASPEAARRMGRILLADMASGNPLQLARLALQIGDDDLVSQVVPHCVGRLLDEYRYNDATGVFCDATAQVADPIPLFDRTDLVPLTRVLSIPTPSHQLRPDVAEMAVAWSFSQSDEVREAVRLLQVIGQPLNGVPGKELLGPPPESPRVRESWIFLRLRSTETGLEEVEEALGVEWTPEQRLLRAMNLMLERPASIVTSSDEGWRDPDDPDRPQLIPPLERRFFLAACKRAWLSGDLARARVLADRIRHCSSDTMAPSMQVARDQILSAIAVGSEPQGNCVRASWSVLRHEHPVSSLSIANVALAEFEFGRLGVSARLAELGLEDPGWRHPHSTVLAHANCYWVFSRLGLGDRLREEPDFGRDDEARVVWLDAKAQQNFAAGRVEQARAMHRELLDLDLAGANVRVEQLVDWILTELDLGNIDYAHALFPHLQPLASDATRRVVEKVRLASCALELALSDKPAADLERLIVRNIEGIEATETYLYRWRGARNLAVLLEKVGRHDESARAWASANKHIQGLLAACRTRREALSFRNTPAMRGFFRDYHGEGEDL